jgi:hypothetical protein
MYRAEEIRPDDWKTYPLPTFREPHSQFPLPIFAMNSLTNLVLNPNPDKPGNPNLWGLEMETKTGERERKKINGG